MVSQGPAGVRVAVTGAGASGVFRVTEMEAALARSFTAAALDGLTVPTDDMIVDMHATAAYRAHLVSRTRPPRRRRGAGVNHTIA